MQVAELQQVLQLCDDFASMTEGFGCRPVPALRAAVQLQCKSYLEHLHQHTFTNLTGLHHDNPLDVLDASPRWLLQVLQECRCVLLSTSRITTHALACHTQGICCWGMHHL